MMTTEDLQKAATQKAEESVELLRSFYAAREHTKEFEPMPDVDVFFNLWGRTAGTALAGSHVGDGRDAEAYAQLQHAKPPEKV